MNTISAASASSVSIDEYIQVTIDREAEPVDWDAAVAKFLINTVRKNTQPAAIPPVVEDGDFIGSAANAAFCFSPLD